MKVLVHEEATAELAAAARYYEDETSGLGLALLDEFESTIETLKQTPRLGVTGPHGARRMLLPRFPFSLFYRIDEDQLLIVAVAHQRRRPGYWKDRNR